MNIYDIAREAGVSIATVSRVLNHKDIVRADTRAKVEKVLKRCNYAPSAIAQGMVSKSLKQVQKCTLYRFCKDTTEYMSKRINLGGVVRVQVWRTREDTQDVRIMKTVTIYM